jgi:hypothetical protein
MGFYVTFPGLPPAVQLQTNAELMIYDNCPLVIRFTQQSNRIIHKKNQTPQ